MFEIIKNDPIIIRTRNHIKEQVERFRSTGKTEEEIINWLESNYNEIGLLNFFDSVNELAEFIHIPVFKFNIVWM